MTPDGDRYEWGEVVDGLQLGLWASRSTVEVGRPADLRAAVGNRASGPAEVGSDFGLCVCHGGEVSEHRSGPRWSGTRRVAGGAVEELLGWRLGLEQLEAGRNTVWVEYDPPSGERVRSGRVEFVARDSGMQ